MVDYYDAILGLIPLSVVGVSGSLVGAGLAVSTALTAGAVVAAAVIGHAMFVRAPVGPGETPSPSAPRPGGSDAGTDQYSTAD